MTVKVVRGTGRTIQRKQNKTNQIKTKQKQKMPKLEVFCYVRGEVTF